MQVAPRPLGMKALPGVQDTRDVWWKNVPESRDANVKRARCGSFIVYAITFNWSVFMTLCYVFASYDTIREWGLAPSLGSLNSSERVFVNYIFSVAPVALISLGLALMPLLLLNLAEHFEKRKLRSEMQLSVLRRNFFLQMVNLWLTVVAGSVWDAVRSILEQPTSFFKFIGKTLPIVSIYFLQIVIIRTFVSNFWEFSRFIPWLRLRAAKIAAGDALTARDHRNNLFLAPEMMYGATYTGHLTVLIILLLFAVIAPMAYIFCLLYFLTAYFVYVHNALHVYVPKYEAGGLFFFPVMTYLLTALCAAQLTLVGYLAVLKAFTAAATVFLLPFSTYAFKRHLTDHYAPACDKAALQLTLARDKEFNRDLAFDPHLYRQPDLDEKDAEPQPPWAHLSDDDDDDDLGCAANIDDHRDITGLQIPEHKTHNDEVALAV